MRTRCLGVDETEVSRPEERESEMAFGSRPQLIGTASTGLVCGGLNLAGGAKEYEQRKPASLFCLSGCSLPGEKKKNIGAVISFQHRGKKLWKLQGLGKKEGSCLG